MGTAHTISTGKKPRSHLVLPDSHAHPRYDNERYEWLGKLILAERPDVIINLGDQDDMPSLSQYDKGTKTGEGLRVWEDLEHGWEASRLLRAPLLDYQARLKSQRKRSTYNPEWFRLGGNHEFRIVKWMAADPAHWRDDWVDFYLKPEGWTFIPFLQPLIVDGICYQHYFTSGTMGRPIGGENMAAQLIKKNYQTCVAGHAHVLDFAERTRRDGLKCFGLSAGCFVHPDYMKQAWCAAQSHLWWNGVVMLRGVVDGMWTGGMEFHTYQSLKRRFG